MDITPDLTAIPAKRSRESNPAEPGTAAAATEGAEDFSAHLPEGKQTRAHKQTDQHARPESSDPAGEEDEDGTEVEALADNHIGGEDIPPHDAADSTRAVDGTAQTHVAATPDPFIVSTSVIAGQQPEQDGIAPPTQSAGAATAFAAKDAPNTARPSVDAATSPPAHIGEIGHQPASPATFALQMSTNGIDSASQDSEIDAASTPRDLQLATPPSTTSTVAGHTAAVQQQGGRSVVSQIAHAVLQTSENRFELTLSPEELGRMRIVISRGDQTPQITVLFERPEAYDMARRNMGLLAQDLHDSGLQDAQLAFGRDRQSDQSAQTWTDRNDGEDRATAPQIIAIAAALGAQPLVSNRHIDIRL